jgi:2-polyprenyl-6-methoxyphenol hydroxylase-like FAD-dependent oxidoreductase
MNDVVVIGAGPVGLMQACELALAGVRPVVLEERAEPSELPKANGLGGLIVQLLDYRGLLPRFTAQSPFYGPFPGFPFGSVALRFTKLAANPMKGVMIQQPKMEAVLAERAAELGVRISRGHELVGLAQDSAECALRIRGPEGEYDLYTPFVVGCDGGRSKVRELTGIGFPGDTDREVLRLGHFQTGATLFDTAEGLQPGWNRTPHGRILVTSLQSGVTIVGVRDEEPAEEGPMTLAELRDALHRVLGRTLPLGDPIWLSRTVSQARIAEKYRAGRVFLAGDAAHLFPAGGSALNVGLLDTVNLGWKLAGAIQGRAPEGLLDTYETERRPVGERALMQTRAQAVLDRVPGEDGIAIRQMFTELVDFDEPLQRMAHLLNGSDTRYATSDADPRVGTFITGMHVDLSAGRPVLLANREDLRATAEKWNLSIQDSHGDAMLVRPDGHIAWVDGERSLEDALAEWLGQPGQVSQAGVS